MIKEKHNTQWLPWFSILFCACYYFIVLYLNQVPQDEGDGLQHFSIAQDAWKDHTLFLHHWGKPLFILFSSSFAQLGFEGYISFNILVFALSCLVVKSILDHYNTPRLLSILFPFVLISIPDYSNSVIGGMTEPFFGLLLVLMFWLALKERFFWFALLCSFTPFARSEGMLVVIASIPYLILLRKWKYIPLLATGFLIYAGIGWKLIDQPLWYFENNPYSPISIYGSGPWYTYLKNALQHLGIVPIIALPFTILGLLIWKTKYKRNDLLHFLFFGGLYLGIIVIHSYLWARGLRGALGLSRLATLGLLPFLAIQGVALGYVFRELHRMTYAFCSLFVLISVYLTIRTSDLPTVTSPYQLALKNASEYLESHEKEVGKIYYFHPLIPYFRGQKSAQYLQRFIGLDTDVNDIFKPGDLIVRDSKFGPVEQGLPFRQLEKYPWIIPVKHFYPNDLLPEGNGEIKSVIIYQVMDKQLFDRQKWDRQQKTKTCSSSLNYSPKKIYDDEFRTIDSAFVIPPLFGPRQLLEMNIQLKTTGENPVHLIFDDKNGCYVSVPITKETTTIFLPFVTGKTKGMLYVHNPSLESYELNIQGKSWTQNIDSGLQTLK